MLAPDPEVERLQQAFDEQDFSVVLRGTAARLTQSGQPASVVAQLRRLAGLASMRIGRQEDALEHLGEAFRLNPTDRDVAAGLGQVLIQLGRRADAVRPFESLLVNHRDDLTPNTVRTVLTHLGLHYLEAGEFRRARARLEEAIEIDASHPVTLRPLVSVYDALGLLDEAAGARRRLIDRLADGAEKTRICRDHAQLLSQAGRQAEALTWSLAAWKSQPTDDLADELLPLLQASGRDRELADVLGTALERCSDERRPDFALRRAAVLSERLGEPVEAAATLEAALDRNPRLLDLFERLVEILARAEAWPLLHDAYARMIARTLALQESTDALVGLLWRKLGELCRTHLEAWDEALTALHTSTSYVASTPEVDQALVDVAGRASDAQAIVDALLGVYGRDQGRVDAGERLAAALIRQGQLDRGYLVLGTVVGTGGASQTARDTFARIQPTRIGAFAHPLHSGVREKYLNPAGDLVAMRTCMQLAWQLLGDTFARTLDDYDIGSRDRIDPSGGLLIARIAQETATQLGLEHTPTLYTWPRVLDGLMSAYMHKPSVLVAPELLSGQDERALRFLVARQFALLDPAFVLPSLLPMQDLQIVLACLIRAVKPEFDVPAGPLTERVTRQLRRALNDTWLKALRIPVEAFFQDGRAADLVAYRAGMVLEVNRTGLVCCDDPATAFGLASKRPVLPDALDDDMLQQSLRAWTWSDAHQQVRARLGIALRPAAGARQD
jgi:tetratricopeptide (TPR) repeat protein